MMLRFPCIGDLHLQHAHRRNSDRLQALDQILEDAIAMGDIGAWLFLGDLYHQRSEKEDRNALAPRLQRAADVAPVFVLYGNHDAAGDLEILARLKARHPIHVLVAAGVFSTWAADGTPLALFALPYLHKHVLVGAGVPSERLGETAAPLLDAMFLDAAEQLRQAEAAGALTLMIGHNTIAGSVSSVGQPMGLDRDIAITAALLDRLGDVPKIFGHIHKPQEIFGAYYAGSVCRNDWGECEDKRWLLVECTDEETRIESHPIDVPKMWHVEGTFSRETGFAWQVKRGPDGEPLELPATWKGADVRVRYHFQESELSLFDRAQILATFAEARTLEPEPITIRERAHRAPEVEAAKTIHEKVAAFVKMRGVEWTPALDAKFAVLQDPDVGGFLTRVEQDLSGAAPDAPAADAMSSSSPGAAVSDSDLFEEVRA